jgi:hypothetical protein
VTSDGYTVEEMELVEEEGKARMVAIGGGGGDGRGEVVVSSAVVVGAEGVGHIRPFDRDPDTFEADSKFGKRGEVLRSKDVGKRRVIVKVEAVEVNDLFNNRDVSSVSICTGTPHERLVTRRKSSRSRIFSFGNRLPRSSKAKAARVSLSSSNSISSSSSVFPARIARPTRFTSCSASSPSLSSVSATRLKTSSSQSSPSSPDASSPPTEAKPEGGSRRVTPQHIGAVAYSSRTAIVGKRAKRKESQAPEAMRSGTGV